MIHFADLHLHPFRAFNQNNQRLKNSIRVLKDMGQHAMKDERIITFSGDLFHNADSMDPDTFVQSLHGYNEYIEKKNLMFFAISGNHDMKQWNSPESHSISYLHGFDIFKSFKLVDFTSYKVNKHRIWGIPYMNSNSDTLKVLKDFNKHLNEWENNHLLIHSDLPNAKNTQGYESGEAEGLKDIYKLLKGFNFVHAGHIHKPQRLSFNTVMLGSPIHQTLGDAGTQMGYWRSKGKKVTFFGLHNYPQFILLKPGQEAPDQKNFYLPQEIIEDVKGIEKAMDFSNLNNNKVLVRRYMRVKGIKDEKKEQLLLDILNQVNV